MCCLFTDLKQELNVKARYTPANGTSGNSSMNSSASLPNGIVVANGDILQQQHDNAATKASSISVNALNDSLANRNEYIQPNSLKSKLMRVLKLSKASKALRHSSKPTNCL